jgi:hypothetical protein
MTVYGAEELDSKAEDKKAWMLTGFISIVLLCVIGGLVWYFVLDEKPSYDKVTGCPLVDGQVRPNAQTVIVIDTTDPLTDIQTDEVRIAINNLVTRSLNNGDLLSIYGVREDKHASRRPLFEACKIRDGSDANALTENERKLKKRFNSFFKEPLHKVLDETTSLKETAKTSPILEVLQSVSVNSIQKWNVEGDRKLVIFSDMLHNTPEWTLYQRKPSFDQFNKTSYAAQVKAPLMGVDVSLYVLMNNPKFQTQRNLGFWREYFKNSGALMESVIPVGK